MVDICATDRPYQRRDPLRRDRQDIETVHQATRAAMPKRGPAPPRPSPSTRPLTPGPPAPEGEHDEGARPTTTPPTSARPLGDS